MKRSWKDAPRDGASRHENTQTQPLQEHRVFNNPSIITEGWYPACRSTDIARGAATSVKLTHQRVAIYRGEDGAVRAIDAFCPHMGADLGNGRVVGCELECYFHQWRFDAQGKVCAMRAPGELPKAQNKVWPVEEKYGWVWVYSAERAPYPVPDCAGLEGKAVMTWHLGSPLLFAHHHVMMAGGIDLQHFASVHALDVRFDLAIAEVRPEIADWKLEGQLPTQGWRARLGRMLLGDRFRYVARFAGGSVVALTYGPDARLGGAGRPLAPLYILWGCVAEPTGVSRVQVNLVAERRPGILGGLKARALLALTAILLVVLRDDDVKAFPNMRFQPGKLLPEDGSVGRFIQWVNRLPISVWSKS